MSNAIVNQIQFFSLSIKINTNVLLYKKFLGFINYY
jgi:hypothetical protein